MRKLIIKSEWTYEDYLSLTGLKDHHLTQQRWLLLIAEVNCNWIDGIDDDIRDAILDANRGLE